MILGILFIAIAYVVGSIETGILICKYKGLGDPRTQGSGSAGATNVLRIGGMSTASLVLVGDALKGFLPVLIAGLLDVDVTILSLVGLAAVAGHIYPVFYEFKGGKGVATAFGVMLALAPLVAIMSLVTWVIIAGLFRYSSLASVATVVVAVLYTVILTDLTYFFAVIAIAALIVWHHWDNIQRLMDGSESQIDFDKFKSVLKPSEKASSQGQKPAETKQDDTNENE